MITDKTQQASTKLLVTGLVALVLLNAADAVFTDLFVARHGLEFEANPLIYWIIDHAGFWGMALFKVVTVGLCVWVMVLYHTIRPLVALAIVYALVIMMIPVVIMGSKVAFG